MGRTRKPNKVKELSGTLRNDRIKDDYLSPKSMNDIPSPPAEFELGELAHKLWTFQVVKLVEFGILNEVDLVELSVWAIEMERYYLCKKVIDEHGEVFKTATGYPQQRPEVSIMRNSFRIAHDIANRFGFNPVSRDNIRVRKTEEANDLIKLLGE